tara:strand:- start:673 stop:1032 length:360 start_codon:yes stop_codon:yes gene_type:complete
MTHYKVEIQIPLFYNLEDGKKDREKIPSKLFYETYLEIFNMVGGIHTSPTPVFGAWRCPKTRKAFFDKSTVFTVLVETNDIKTINNIPKMKELIEYKKILKKRFKQHEIFMVATRCQWL